MCFGLYRLHLISTGSPRLWYGERVRGREREGGGREKKRRGDGGRDRWSEAKESSDLQLAAGSNQRRGPERLGRREEKKEEKKNPRDHTALLLFFCERSTDCICSPANLPSGGRHVMLLRNAAAVENRASGSAARSTSVSRPL